MDAIPMGETSFIEIVEILLQNAIFYNDIVNQVKLLRGTILAVGC